MTQTLGQTFGDLDAQNHRPLDQRMTGNVGELRVEPCTPARVEGKDGLHLVEYVEARRHACFDRMLVTIVVAVF